MQNAISAISTAPGVGGVAIIRISGNNSLGIAEKMFKPIGKTPVGEFEPYKMYVGNIQADGFDDFGMCVYFRAPKSYTGEDMVEFHCHGGIAITRGILKRTFELGAKPATKGEFTRRAFVNGKMSLASAEGLIDMINGESVGEAKAGYYLYREKLTEKIIALQSKLTYALAYIDAGIDYPEEGVTEDNYDEIIETLRFVKDEIGAMISRYGAGRKIKHGVKVAIVGRPNVGKSSLLNRLLDYDKAIVSPIAGTTRDAVEGEIDINGIKFCFTDTAGIRDSDDLVESVGIDRARRFLRDADVCLLVIDGSSEFTEEDENLLEETKDRQRVIVMNKSDIAHKNVTDADVTVSAETGENIDELKRLLYEKAFDGNVDLNADYLTEERHLYALKSAEKAIGEVICGFTANTADLSAIDIKNAWDALGEISGETASEAIIDEIFSKFCVGK